MKATNYLSKILMILSFLFILIACTELEDCYKKYPLLLGGTLSDTDILVFDLDSN